MKKKMKLKRKLKRTPEEAENTLIGLFATVYSGTVDQVTKKYGKEGFEIARKGFIDSMVKADIEEFKKIKEKNLRAYVEWLLSVITLGHRYEVVEDKDDSVRFRFTNCPWANFFRSIGKPEIGKFFCDADGPLAEAFNKDIKFEITKTLMDGDDHCNHHYFIEKSK